MKYYDQNGLTNFEMICISEAYMESSIQRLRKWLKLMTLANLKYIPIVLSFFLYSIILEVLADCSVDTENLY